LWSLPFLGRSTNVHGYRLPDLNNFAGSRELKEHGISFHLIAGSGGADPKIQAGFPKRFFSLKPVLSQDIGHSDFTT
jgi:hypothetical protein